MANWRRSLGDAFWAVDRAMGGQRRPTRVQKRAARHPIGTGLGAALPVMLFCLTLSGEETAGDLPFAVLAGAAMGLAFGLTALSERLRQRRLKRLGLWNGNGSRE